MGAGRSASDTSELSAGGVLCCLTLPGSFDAPTDSLPRLVVVGGGIVDGDIVSVKRVGVLGLVGGFRVRRVVATCRVSCRGAGPVG